jgi:GT2 family glycosyltransferase/glycosyltransferase involved in cell wall biosynthesis
MDGGDGTDALAAPRRLMRVLLVVHGFPPSGLGGTELYADRIARGLTVAGHEVAVFTREAVSSAEEHRVRDERRDGLHIRWVNNTFRNARTLVETYENPRVTRLLDAFVQDVRPDVAHVHHLTCLSTTIVDALAARGVPVILHLHDYWLLCHRGQLLDTALQRCAGPGVDGCARCTGPEGAPPAAAFRAAGLLRGLRQTAGRAWPVSLEGRMRRWLSDAGSAEAARAQSRRRLEHMRARFANVALAIAPSAHVRNRFVGAGFPEARIVVSENGVDAARRAPTRTGGALRVGFLGALMVSKAPHLIAEAIELAGAAGIEAHYYGAPSAYHGDTAYSDAIVGRLCRAGARVHGHVEHRDVAARLAEIDVLVFPSIWEEASGLGALEALAAGVPVVASRIGGIPEFVRHDLNGLLFSPGDAADLARQLRRLREEPDLLPRLRGGIAPVRAFADDLAATIARYVDVRAHVASRIDSPRVSAVVLNYQTPAETANTVTWLRMSDPPLHEIVVVDNGDGRALGEALGNRNGARLVATNANLGFAGGINAGIRAVLETDADAVLLVNSDVAVPPSTVRTLSRALEGAVGIAGPIVRSRTYPDRHLSAGIDFDHWTGRMRARTSSSEDAKGLPTAVSGCVMLVHRHVLETIGLLAEPYFFGFEDIEFCQRARRAGFETALVTAAVAYHAGGATMGTSADRLYYGARNHLRLSRDTPSRSRAHAGLRWLAIVGYSAMHAATARGGSLPERLWAIGHGVIDDLRGRVGPRR